MDSNAKSRSNLAPADQSALNNFDQLPDSAEVSVRVIAARHSISNPTVWRWTIAGKLPQPIRRGGVTRWNVGELRRALAQAV